MALLWYFSIIERESILYNFIILCFNGFIMIKNTQRLHCLCWISTLKVLLLFQTKGSNLRGSYKGVYFINVWLLKYVVVIVFFFNVWNTVWHFWQKKEKGGWLERGRFTFWIALIKCKVCKFENIKLHSLVVERL